MPELSVTTQGNLFDESIPAPVMPFGKYEGKPIEVLLADPEYVTWLQNTSKPAFRARFPTVFQFIAVHYGEPSRTPDHNALQNRFLDREFQLKFALAAYPEIAKWVTLHRVNLSRTFEEHFQRREKALRSQASRGGYWGQTLEKDLQTLFAEREPLAQSLTLWAGTGQDEGASIKHPVEAYDLHLEHGGSDVVYQLSHEWQWCQLDHEGYPPRSDSGLLVTRESRWFKVQIKPVMGDDYPAVLRSMKAVHSYQLLVRDYTGRGGDWETVQRVFALDGIRALRLSDVEGTSIPAEFDRVQKPSFDVERFNSAAS